MVRTPLRHPHAYFARKDGFSLFRAAGVVLLLWASVVVGSLALVVLLAARIPHAPPGTMVDAIGVALGQMLPVLLVLGFSWLMLGVLLFSAARLAGGNGSFTRTLAIAAWGLAPTIGVILLVVGIGGVEVVTAAVPADLQAATERFGVILDNATQGTGVVLQFGTAIWQMYLFTGGLVVGHNLDWGPAAFASGAVALTGFMFALV